MPTKRIFIAVDISHEAREAVASYINELRRSFSNLRIGWERPEKLHLTLKFLGDVDEERILNIQNLIEQMARDHKRLQIKIAETGVFPNARNPRILWFGVSGEKGKLEEIAHAIESECEKLGFPAEKHSFSPHLTFARIREPQKARELAAGHLVNEFEPVEFEVSEIVIYESKLAPTGSVYSKLVVFPLA